MNTETNNETRLAVASGNSVYSGISSNDISGVHGKSISRNVTNTFNVVNSKSVPNVEERNFDGFRKTLKRVSYLETLMVAISFIIFLVIAQMITGCGPKAVDLNNYANALDQCKAQGKDAGSYQVYESCAKETDIKFGRKEEK